MNSHWKGNSMLFAMKLVLTRSDGQTKIGVFPWSHGEKLLFMKFSRIGTQIEGR